MLAGRVPELWDLRQSYSRGTCVTRCGHYKLECACIFSVSERTFRLRNAPFVLLGTESSFTIDVKASVSQPNLRCVVSSSKPSNMYVV